MGPNFEVRCIGAYQIRIEREILNYFLGRMRIILNQQPVQIEVQIQLTMNCHQKSEAHLWRYSKTNKTRRCLKCKSLIKITKEEFALKWGMEKRK